MSGTSLWYITMDTHLHCGTSPWIHTFIHVFPPHTSLIPPSQVPVELNYALLHSKNCITDPQSVEGGART